jgi:hypothetical protein
MGRYKKIPFDKVANVYAKKAGNISATCTSLGIDRNTFTSWRLKYKKLDELLREIEESLIDFSESKLLEQIQDGNLTAIIFHLKTKGKSRGYVEGVDLKANIESENKLVLPKLTEEDIEQIKKINNL